MTLGQYVPGNSFLHRLDPRTKLIIVAMVMVAIFWLDNPICLLVAGLSAFLVGVAAKLKAGYMLRGLRFVWLFAFFSLIFNMFLVPGDACCSIWDWQITYQGIWRGLAMGLRLVLLVLLTSMLSLTTSPIMLTDGMEKLLSPGRYLGVPTHELAMVSTIALRFVPTLAQEMETIIKVQLARGASIDRGSLIQRARSLLPIMIPLFVSAFRHAEDLAWAMEARCYRGGQGRTRLRELYLGIADAAAASAIVVFFIFLKVLEHYI
ncbi:MAG: energy-coupling factor transporter transmembrane component T family protein [Candidatus Bruticola sp.]